MRRSMRKLMIAFRLRSMKDSDLSQVAGKTLESVSSSCLV